MYLHSDAREQQGKDLTAAWQKVDLQPYFTERQARRKAIVQAELDAVPKVQAALLAAEQQTLVTACVGAGPDSLRDRVRANIASFTGEQACTAASCPTAPLLKEIDKWRGAARNLALNQRQQATMRLALGAAGGQAANCHAIVAAPPAPSLPQDAIDAYKALAQLCGKADDFAKQHATAGATIARLAPARPGKSWAAVEQNRTDIAAREKEANELAAEYETAMADVEAAVARAKPSDLPSAEMTAAVARVHKVLDKIAKNVEARSAAAAVRIRKLDAILGKVGKTGEPPNDATRAEVTAVLLTRTADSVQTWRNAMKPVPAASLLLRRDLDERKLEAARRELALLRQKSTLLEERFAADIDEMRPLLVAHDKLDQHAGNDHVRFDDAIASTPGKPSHDPAPAGSECRMNVPRAPLPFEQRTALLDAAGGYLESVGPKRIHGQQVTIQLAEVDDELTQVRDEAALAQKTALVEASSVQAAAFAASGQKPADWLAPVQTFLLFWIGEGVH